jgi:hypothetical protein
MLTCESREGDNPAHETPRNNHQMSTAMDTQALQPQGYTRSEMRWRLSRVRQGKVPDPTLNRWLKDLAIEPNDYGLYDDRDLQILTSLVLFLKRCRNIEKFKTLLIKEIFNHASESRETDRTIEN